MSALSQFFVKSFLREFPPEKAKHMFKFYFLASVALLLGYVVTLVVGAYWFTPMTPETAETFIRALIMIVIFSGIAFLGGVTGVVLFLMGKWAQKFQQV